ncbi:MAG: hypothetical protein U1E18_19765 [Brevundimonas sp.]|jgi:hypothetical protein|uniref:hypothetical protein n=1 Tax=Brevundimonas sp. TaxID=1871086 RepID=UPI002AB9E99C|nr:hypothetical protein [Brevundimonas sp.]MDZ4111814.1 hypothetical protein [Brevundimonas sp.]
MTRNLDDLLVRSAAAPVDRSLDGLEPLVWRRVDVLRGERLVAQLRFGTVAMALAAGLTVGGVGAVAAPRPPGDMAIFTVDAGLSPLVRLGAGR